MVSLNNPAGRLHHLLEQARWNKPEKKVSVQARWAEVLELDDPEDRAELLLRISEVLTLPGAVRAEIAACQELSVDVYLKHLHKIERAFSNLNFGLTWEQFIGPIDESAMFALEMCDERLSALRPQPMLPEEARERIHEKVQDLLQDVLSNEEDDELRDFLLRHVGEMDRALKQYKVRGAQVVRDSAHAALGEIVAREVEGKAFPDSDGYRRFKEILTLLLMTLNIVTATAALTQMGLPELPAGPPAVSVDEEPDPGQADAEP